MIRRVSAGTPLDERTRGGVLDALLAQNPTGLIVAIDPRGFFVPMPESVPIGARRPIMGHTSALELVIPGEGKTIIDTWVRAQEHGVAHAQVHLRAAPDAAVTAHFVDARSPHGCYLGLFFGVDDHVRPDPDHAPMRPRYTVVHKNLRAIITATDDMMPRILGWSRDDLVGGRSLELMHPDDHPQAIANWMDMLAAPGEARRVRVRHKHKNGGWVWVELTNYNRLADPANPHVLTEIVDVSDEMAALEALRASEHTLRRLAEALPIGVLQIDRASGVVYHNSRGAEILGGPTKGALPAWLSRLREADRAAVDTAVAQALAGGGDVDLEIEVHHPRGALRCHLRLRSLSAEAEGITGAILCLEDVTTDVRLREELRQRATYDALTGCLNRSSIMAALQLALAERRRGSSPEGVGLLFIDLDRFKEINDQLGHADGDATLVAVARRVAGVLRSDDLVGRLGGDEFLVICPRVVGPADAEAVAQRVAEAIAQPLSLSTRVLRPSASIGVTWTESGKASPDELIAHADRAMYQSKRDRRGEPVLAPPNPFSATNLDAAAFGRP